MNVVAFLLKRNQPEAVALCERLVQALRRLPGHAEMVVSDGVEVPPGVRTVREAELPRTLRLMVVLGGDGTLLYGAGLVRDTGVPLLGVNLGHLGFLSACSPEQAVEGLHAALGGRLPLEERQRLCCRVRRVSRDAEVEVIVEREAVNEVVLSQPAQARLLTMDAYVDGEVMTTYRADGLIISTPTGSTAYNLAAGGPILTPQLKAMVLTPICPHTLTARPVVAPLSSCIEVRPGSEPALLTIDGQWNIQLQPADRVEVTCAQSPLLIYRPPDHTFFDLLRAKLHWGVRA
jgi:NAD+ kinase